MFRKLLLPALFLAFFTNMAFAQRGGITGTVTNEEDNNKTSFTINDALKLTSVYNPRMSPDGTHVLFTKRTLEWEDNEYVSHLVMVNVEEGDSWVYTSKAGDGSAKWSPTGRWISFLRTAKSEEDDEKNNKYF